MYRWIFPKCCLKQQQITVMIGSAFKKCCKTRREDAVGGTTSKESESIKRGRFHVDLHGPSGEYGGVVGGINLAFLMSI